MSTPGTIRVLHVDDDPDFLELSKRLLESHDRLHVETELDPEAGLERLDEVDCVVLDYRMDGADGLSLLRRLREEYSLPVVFFTGAGSEEVASEAISLGVTDYLRKSVDSEQFTLLANRIEYLVDKERAEAAAFAAEQRVRTVYERISVAFFAVDDDWRFTYLNDRAESLFEADEETLLGTTLWEAFPDLRETEAERELREAATDQLDVTCEAELASLGKHVVMHGYPDESGISVFVEDVTDQHEQREELESLRTELEITEEQFRTLRQKLARPPSPFRG